MPSQPGSHSRVARSVSAEAFRFFGIEACVAMLKEYTLIARRVRRFACLKTIRASQQCSYGHSSTVNRLSLNCLGETI